MTPYLREAEAYRIKSITTRQYTLELIEMYDGGYRVQYEYGNEHFCSKDIDLKTALFVFEDFKAMLEGN